MTMLIFLWVMAVAICCGSALDLSTFPVAYTQHNRIMSFILSFSFDHIDPLMLIFNEYVSMCEGLAMQHKPVLQKEVDNYDFFVYHEDDIIFKHSHLVAYLYETRKIAEMDTDPQGGLYNSVIGFQRFRRIQRGDLNAHFGENDIFEQEMLEETPTFTPICYKDNPYLMITKNTHQAIWAFTTIQIKILQEKCHFTEHMQPSREFMSSFLVFEHKHAHCAMNKLIPAERLMTFSIWHYYQQRHVSWSSLFYTDEYIRSGYHAYGPREPVYIPSCWEKIVAQGRFETALPPTATPTAAPTAAA